MKTFIIAVGWVGLVLLLCFIGALLQEIIFGDYLRKAEYKRRAKNDDLYI